MWVFNKCLFNDYALNELKKEKEEEDCERH